MKRHVPVLLNEVLDFLITRKDGIYFEGTIGFGGHTEQILERLTSEAKYFGTDKDSDAFEYCKEKFTENNRTSFYNTSFINIDTISRLDSLRGFDGIFLDLGVSSFQLDNATSGFSYKTEADLDLRMNKSTGFPAHHYINKMAEKELADIIYKYGEERKSRQIAYQIVKQRNIKKIRKTSELSDIVERVIGTRNLNKSLSRVFQAFRIFVNNELDELAEFLNKCVDLLNPDARLVLISFHSLEDRIIKDFFKYESKECICPPETPVCVCGKLKRLKILTGKPVIPLDEELKSNPRSRSAKLRAAERI